MCVSNIIILINLKHSYNSVVYSFHTHMDFTYRIIIFYLCIHNPEWGGRRKLPPNNITTPAQISIANVPSVSILTISLQSVCQSQNKRNECCSPSLNNKQNLFQKRERESYF